MFIQKLRMILYYSLPAVLLTLRLQKVASKGTKENPFIAKTALFNRWFADNFEVCIRSKQY